MPRILVCSLARIHETARANGARRLLTLINEGTPVETPPEIDHHLFIGMSDVNEAREGHIAPAARHVGQTLDFARQWDRKDPMIVHCWAGVSRSTAAAFTIACALAPERDEMELARILRRLSPTATPNPLFVAEADTLLGRSGRMIAAVGAIGRGEDCFEGTPFALEV